MHLVIAAAPILVATGLLLVFRQPVRRAGLYGFATALGIALLDPVYALPPRALTRAIFSGLLNTLVVVYVLLGGLTFYYVLWSAGAFRTVTNALVRAVADPGRRTLLLVFGISVFFEAATGSGIGIVILTPVFLAFGLSPQRAVLVALAGQCGAGWGALSIGTVLASGMTGVPAWTMGWMGAAMSVPYIVVCGGMALWWMGGRHLLRRHLGDVLCFGGLLALLLGAGSRWIGVEVAGMLAGLGVTLVILAVTRAAEMGQAPEAAPQGKGLMRALIPNLLLLATLLTTRLAPPIRRVFTSWAVLDLPDFQFRLPLLYHSGFWVTASALMSAPILGLTGPRLRLALRAAGRQWVSVSIAIAAFLCFSSLMYAAGMTNALAVAVADGAGRLYGLVLPSVGALGGFLTGSGSGSHAMFAQFQLGVARRLHLPVDVAVSAHNVASGDFTLVSPSRLVLGAAIAGIPGQEGRLIRQALTMALAGLAGVTAISWLWLRP